MRDLAKKLNKKVPVIVSLEGIIGAAKTTTLAELERLDPERKIYTIVREPVEEWQPRLEKFYENPAANALSFQMYVIASRIRTLLTAIANEPRNSHMFIVERSVIADYLFAGLNLKEKTDFESYEIYHHALTATWAAMIIPDVSIFLDASIEHCMERIADRKRPGEEAISVDYMSSLALSHRLTFREECADCITIPDSHTLQPEEIAARVRQIVSSPFTWLRVGRNGAGQAEILIRAARADKIVAQADDIRTAFRNLGVDESNIETQFGDTPFKTEQQDAKSEE